jgi:hypothetical protein
MLWGRHASRRSEARFPTLWDGRVFSACPSIQGPSGLRLWDTSGRSNHGTLTAMDTATAWARNAGAYALKFDGSNDRVLVANSPAFATPKDLTVSFWVNTASSGSNVELIQKMGAGESRVNSSWESYLNSSGRVYFRLNGTENNLISTVNLPLSAWVNVVLRKTGATIAIFFNTAAAGTLGGQPDVNISTGSLTLGAYPDGSFPINASFDDIVIYNRSLTSGEIRTLARRRGVSYDMRRDVVEGSSGFQAAWARRQGQIIGGGV